MAKVKTAVLHGSFKSEAAARAKERETPGSWIVPRNVAGQGKRWIVLSRRARRNPSVPDAELRDRAAAALDATHDVGERGPRTFQARQRVAVALDAGRRPPLVDVKHLEKVARDAGRARLQGFEVAFYRSGMWHRVLGSSQNAADAQLVADELEHMGYPAVVLGAGDELPRRKPAPLDLMHPAEKARRARRNPVVAIVGNPGRVFGKEVELIRYEHVTEGRRYHRFKRGTKLEALPDGSVRIYNPTRPVWVDDGLE